MSKTDRSTLLALSVCVLILASTGLARADAIATGYDLLETDRGATLDDLVLPPGFFGPGSDPFEGRVYLKGVPFPTFDRDGPGPMPPWTGLLPTDTIVQRMAPAGPAFPSTIPIQIVALSLVSAAPFTVTFGGGASSQQWSLSAVVSVSPVTGLVDPAQGVGSMTIRHQSAGGGTFDSTLPVTPMLTFTRVGGPGIVGPMVSPVTFSFGVSNDSWSHVANPLIFPGDGQTALTIAGVTTNFFPGCVCAACPAPVQRAVCFSVDGGAFNFSRNGAPLTPLPNPAEGLIVPDPRHVPPNDVYALGNSPGVPPGAPPGGHGYATEGEIFQSDGDPLGAPPDGSNVDRMSASLGVGPIPGGPPYRGPFSPNPGAPAPAPPPPGGLGTFGLSPNDNIDALSFGKDSGHVLLFSVNPATLGIIGTHVRVQAVTSPVGGAVAVPFPTNPGGGSPGDEAAGDLFKSLPFAPFGSYIPLHYATGHYIVPATLAANELAIDEFLLGLQAPANRGSAIAAPEDDLDAVELSDAGDAIFGVDLIRNATGIGPPDGIPDRPVFFSLDRASPSLAPLVDPGDILVVLPPGFAFGVFADGTTHIGLLPGDDIDGIAVSDVAPLGIRNPGLDEALFSLHPGSPSVRFGPDGLPGTGDEVSAADVFYTSFTGVHVLYASAGALGLLSADNVNAIDILPKDIPAPGGGGGSKKKLSQEEALLAKHGVRVAQKRRCDMSTTGTFTVTIFGFGTFPVNLQGPSSGMRTATEFDPQTGRTIIATELLSMNLTGNSPLGPVIVLAGREQNLTPSLGANEPLTPKGDLAAFSFFDVFVRIDVAGMQLRNQSPIRVQTEIADFPPYGSEYQGIGPVTLVDSGGNPRGTLDAARHRPRCLVAADCDDNDACTTDSCLPTGECSHLPLPDADGDGVCDGQDTCAGYANPGQGPVVFPESIRWPDKNQFCWTTPLVVDAVQGPLNQVSVYTHTLMLLPPGPVACVPASGNASLYYLAQPKCPAGSWQSVIGMTPGRDVVLP